MTEQEKSLKLAELMGWDLKLLKNFVRQENDELKSYHICTSQVDGCDMWEYVKFNPYSSSVEGLAQFAAILLKFPEVIFSLVEVTSIVTGRDMGHENRWYYYDFNQSNILDEILRMNGVKID